jgi:hypothetical protein
VLLQPLEGCGNDPEYIIPGSVLSRRRQRVSIADNRPPSTFLMGLQRHPAQADSHEFAFPPLPQVETNPTPCATDSGSKACAAR